MRRRLIVLLIALLLLAGATVVLWTAFDWPPPRLLLKYGLPSSQGPTGRTETWEGVEFVEISEGCFRMGSHFLCEEGDLLGRVCAAVGLSWGKQPKHDERECPVRWMEIERPFWIAKTEVSHEQYLRYSPHHVRRRFAYPPGDDFPVTIVTKREAVRYCAWLATRSNRRMRLPTEVEWECACRAGSRTEYSFGDDPGGLAEFAWYHANAGSNLQPIGSRRPNAWGLHGLHGNVVEWCRRIGGSITPMGGGASLSAVACRSAARDPFSWYREANPGIGFRPVFTLPPGE